VDNVAYMKILIWLDIIVRESMGIIGAMAHGGHKPSNF
jgi:hypothetical protein